MIDQTKLDSITSAYLSTGNMGFQIGSSSGGMASGAQIKSPFKLLKEAEQSESNLDYAQGGNLQTIYTMK